MINVSNFVQIILEFITVQIEIQASIVTVLRGSTIPKILYVIIFQSSVEFFFETYPYLLIKVS